MDRKTAHDYYSRKEIQKAILSFGQQGREIGVQYSGGYFGKRPDTTEFLSDVDKFVKKGVFSFHCSEERWENPLMLDASMKEEEKDKNRIGWDLILDLDGVDFYISKIFSRIIIDFLEKEGVKNVSVKFSGNKGFHIGVPFESFSKEIIGLGNTSSLFPEVARKIASYIVFKLRGEFAKSIMEIYGSIEKIAAKFGFDPQEITSDDEEAMNLEWSKLMEIDTILISSRHLFRMPYSLHEKSGLVSIPVKKENVMDFEPFLAKPEKVEPSKYKNFEFLSYDPEHGKDADVLLTKAYEDDYFEMISSSISKNTSTKKGDFQIDEDVDIKDFPNTINYILENSFPDGRKRALFVLMTFLYSIRWSRESIEKLVSEWNEKQEEPLRENYLQSQLNWFANQERIISPPNFENEDYYENLGIPKKTIQKDINRFKSPKIKNPLHFIMVWSGRKKKSNQNKE